MVPYLVITPSSQRTLDLVFVGSDLNRRAEEFFLSFFPFYLCEIFVVLINSKNFKNASTSSTGGLLNLCLQSQGFQCPIIPCLGVWAMIFITKMYILFTFYYENRIQI